MIKNLALIALLSPTLALAADCEHSQDRELKLDLEGITSVRFEINSHELRLTAASGAGPRLSARACASEAKFLEQLVFEQRRVGDTLVVIAERRGQASGIFWNNYANLHVDAQLPAELAYDVAVGSGDAWISNLRQVNVAVGSGDLEVNNITGLLSAKVNSGDIEAKDLGELVVLSVGSGDLTARGIRGDAKVRSVNSGDVELEKVGGSVEIGSIGSGDVDLRGIGGSVSIDSIGSGDADVDDVQGDLRVGRIGSGDVSPSGIRGRTDLPRRS